MPYTMDNMPESMKGAPKQAMEIFIAAFNSAFEKKGNWMSPAGGGAGGGNHAETYPLWMEHKWIPVFEAGIHTDSNGNTKEWTETDLDHMIQNYDPDKYEAPEVIGHPEDDSPRWGAIEALKREGKYLYAMAKDRVPEFVEMLKKKMFKPRSISVYPDGTFRHLGWLGARAPSVKGLPNVAFKDGKGSIYIEFGEVGTVIPKSEIRNMSSTQIGDPKSFFGREAKGMKWFDWLKGKASAEGVMLEDAPVNFSAPNPPPAPASGGQYSSPPAGDIKALVDAEVAKVVTAKNAEFAEQSSRLKAESDRLKAEGDKLEKAKVERQKADIADFCEGLCKDGGRLTPAMMKYGMGMENFLESISGIETNYEFCEPKEGKKLTPAEHMKGFLACFKKQIEFGEFAGAGKDIPKGNDKRDAAIKDYQEKNRKDGEEITYKEAVLAVSKQNPELFQG